VGRGDEGGNAPDLRLFVEDARERMTSYASPKEVAGMPQFSAGMTTLSMEQYANPELSKGIEQKLLFVLVWGLSNPDRFEAWYASSLAETESRLPLMHKMGVEIDEALPTLEQFYEAGELIVRDYEAEINPLPSIPPRLLADAEALGWRIASVDDSA
jgi:hypothetical protein